MRIGEKVIFIGDKVVRKFSSDHPSWAKWAKQDKLLLGHAYTIRGITASGNFYLESTSTTKSILIHHKDQFISAKNFKEIPSEDVDTVIEFLGI